MHHANPISVTTTTTLPAVHSTPQLPEPAASDQTFPFRSPSTCVKLSAPPPLLCVLCVSAAHLTPSEVGSPSVHGRFHVGSMSVPRRFPVAFPPLEAY